ncbi:LysR family transcriptional regulator [Aurantiacibacter xanthus]|uniref:LysR family transcriptional regulator n=1 Tax=Aurantiacibacter xanthus TaxID=1784712 RepID=A0A3A1NYA6_9SPHN|nr:LysR family transcriptional regulator [Aurantiacibacter xanthus]RIV80107.1 LysR family transcriptional regulator [Aurantiacibacter xanthus]
MNCEDLFRKRIEFSRTRTPVLARKRIEFRHLHAFVAVCEHRHFTKAAQFLAISQPALSSLISQLEQDLGMQLLIRTTRSVEMTPTGREFLSSAIRIVGDLQRSVQEVQDYTQLRRGRLRIAALPSLCTYLLPEAAAQFARQHEGISISIVDVMGDEVVERVTRRQVDFGIGYVSSTEMVSADPILTDRLVALGTTDFLGDDTSLKWNELAAMPIIAMSDGTTVRSLVERGCREAGIAPDFALEANQMPSAIAYARAGLGVAILPSSAVVGPAEDLRSVDLIAPQIERSLSVIRTRDNPISPPAAAFLKILRNLRAPPVAADRSGAQSGRE